MRINFFEEFPISLNLSKAKLIQFPSTIFLAATSLEHFNTAKKKLKKINPKLEAAYWPILPKSYWMSPFSYPAELKALLNDLQNKPKNLKVMLDLEFPRDKKLFYRNSLWFFKNKSIIKKIFRLNNLYTAEYPIYKKSQRWQLQALGLSYNIKKFLHKKIIMYYTSMIPPHLHSSMKELLLENAQKYQENMYIGLGTIIQGIHGNEPILSPKNLDKDLNFLKQNNIKNAVIFRLGGLNKNYMKVIRKYT